MLGPTPSELEFNPKLPPVAEREQLDSFVEGLEKQVSVKPGNEAKVVWFDDSLKTETEYALVYLHGFSASHMEGNPVHVNLGKAFGMNVYLSRLSHHGVIEDEPMVELTASGLLRSAQEALAVGSKLGKKVILMSHSTGGSLSLLLAAKYPEIVRGLILYSPNIEIKDENAKLINDPYGVQLARLIKGSDYHEWDADEERNKYWTTKYRLEAVAELQEFVEETMTLENFSRIEQPVFLGYFYKNEEVQDDVVKVDAMLKMYDALGTPKSVKQRIAYPDANSHVIACDVISDNYKKVEEDTKDFLQFQMGLTKAH